MNNDNSHLTVREPLDFTRKLQTEYGKKVKIISSDSMETSSPVIGILEGHPVPLMWNIFGEPDAFNKEVGCLEYSPPREKFYVIIHEDGATVLDEPPVHSVGSLLHIVVDPDKKSLSIEAMDGVIVKDNTKQIPVILKGNVNRKKVSGNLVGEFMRTQKISDQRSALEKYEEISFG